MNASRAGLVATRGSRVAWRAYAAMRARSSAAPASGCPPRRSCGRLLPRELPNARRAPISSVRPRCGLLRLMSQPGDFLPKALELGVQLGDKDEERVRVSSESFRVPRPLELLSEQAPSLIPLRHQALRSHLLLRDPSLGRLCATGSCLCLRSPPLGIPNSSTTGRTTLGGLALGLPGSLPQSPVCQAEMRHLQ